MATIQIRDVSEDTYEVIRRRARRSGKSIQAYMRDEIEQLAASPDDDELFRRAEALGRRTGLRTDAAQLAADRDADRR